MRATTSELLRYTVASGAALAVDTGLLVFLVSYAEVPYLAASAFSFVVGGVLLYFICVKLVFRHRSVSNPALELPLFVALGLVGLAVNCLVMYVAVNQLEGSYLAAKCVAACCTFSVNFVLRRTAMFSRHARTARSMALAD